MSRSFPRCVATLMPALALVASAVLASGCRGGAQRDKDGRGIDVPRGLLVAHALGGIDGMAHTNSLEALRCNHRRGYRWFEVDLALTEDAELVAFHLGHEKNAGLDRLIAEVPLAEVRRVLYRQKFPIVTLNEVLSEATALGDVVLVTDTKHWSAPMLAAVERVVRAAPSPRPKMVLQAYDEKHLATVAELADKLDAGVIFTLYLSRKQDPAVVELAKQYGVLAIVASRQRFNPWLAEQLHAAHIPLLVHTVNDHETIVSLTRAGADGFYTDTYIPYDRMMAERQSVLDCGAAQPSSDQLRSWVRRDIDKAEDYRLSSCAERHDARVELSGCDDAAAISGASLAAPPRSHVRIELEVEAPTVEVDFWFQVIAKDGAKPRAREVLHLAARERRAFVWDIPLPKGSGGLETRLGLASKDVQLSVHRLATTLQPGLPSDAPPPAAPRG